jgi:hypothetical protein
MLGTPISFLHVLSGVRDAILAQGEFPFIFKALSYIHKPLIAMYLRQISTKSARSFSNIFIELILNFHPLQNILFQRGTSVIQFMKLTGPAWFITLKGLAFFDLIEVSAPLRDH